MFEELPVIPTVNDSIQFWKFFESFVLQYVNLQII